jgi:hypothetical protein
MEEDPYILVNLQQKVVDGAMSKNLMGIIVKNNVDYGGLIETKMTNICLELMALHFSSSRKKWCLHPNFAKNAPFVIRVHCMAHQTNIVIVQTLSELSLVLKIECHLRFMYNYNSKCALEANKLVEIL